MLSGVMGRGWLPTLLSPLLSAGRTLTHLTTRIQHREPSG
jgi:hypothetical protein